jgi:hypothetical protein
MKVQLREFYSEVTGEPSHLGSTAAKRSALARWGVPFDAQGTAGGKTTTKVDAKYLAAAIESFQKEEAAKEKKKVRARPAAIASKQDGVDVYTVLVEILETLKRIERQPYNGKAG